MNFPVSCASARHVMHDVNYHFMKMAFDENRLALFKVALFTATNWMPLNGKTFL